MTYLLSSQDKQIYYKQLKAVSNLCDNFCGVSRVANKNTLEK